MGGYSSQGGTAHGGGSQVMGGSGGSQLMGVTTHGVLALHFFSDPTFFRIAISASFTWPFAF